MDIEKIDNLRILPRYIKTTSEGLRIFQKELIDAILNCKQKIIVVEAPVGSGKTFAIHYLLVNKFLKRQPLILLYPTKILMEAQINSLKNGLGSQEIKVWPYDEFESNKINLALYSTDSLIIYVKRKGIDVLKERRSELLYRLFVDIPWFSQTGGIISSPDVFYLIVKGKYKNSSKILNTIKRSIIVFDEFHCYYGLAGFKLLLEELCFIADKIILLSATPIMNKEIEEVCDKYGGIKYIKFESSKGNEKDICFNYALEGSIYSFKISDIKQTVEILKEILSYADFPAAIIFDSIFRLRHIKREIEKIVDKKIFVKEWSGMKKEENLILDKKTLVLGTSSIEVGIDMKFKTLVFESSYWTSGIQRLGRVGRSEEGNFIILTRKDFYPYLKNKKKFERDEFEDILKEVLNEPKEEIGDEYFFRGRSYKFLLYDVELREPFIYNENVFAMYDINEFIDDWQLIRDEEKIERLKNFGVSEEMIEELIIYDKILPLWGLLKGRIKNEYEYLSYSDVKFIEDRNELHIEKGPYVFYGR